MKSKQKYNLKKGEIIISLIGCQSIVQSKKMVVKKDDPFFYLM